MEQYKKDFIDFLLDAQALKIGGEYTLKSGRKSPYFFNLGDLNDGQTTAKIAEAYAASLHASGISFDLIYGIPEKGVGLVAPVALKLYEKHGVNKGWFFTRKFAKTHGEASALSIAEKVKARVVGRAPRSGQALAQLDDVFTSGEAKYQAIEDLAELGTFVRPVLVIALNRQEVGVDGLDAIEQYEITTGTKVVSIINTSEVCDRLRERNADADSLLRIEAYLRQFGTSAAKTALRR
jgi:orotate phosphoribosyltransferase